MGEFTEEQQKRIGYLQTIANKYGNFRVTYLKKNPDGTIDRRKWKSVLHCWHNDEDGLLFLANANNREPLPMEIFIDIDIDLPKPKQIEILNGYCDFFENQRERYIAYESGSKGYHIHVYVPKLAIFTREKRERYKEELFKLLNTVVPTVDELKKSENHMLAIENVPHWKTGNKKIKVRSNWEIC